MHHKQDIRRWRKALINGGKFNMKILNGFAKAALACLFSISLTPVYAKPVAKSRAENHIHNAVADRINGPFEAAQCLAANLDIGYLYKNGYYDYTPAEYASYVKSLSVYVRVYDIHESRYRAGNGGYAAKELMKGWLNDYSPIQVIKEMASDLNGDKGAVRYYLKGSAVLNSVLSNFRRCQTIISKSR